MQRFISIVAVLCSFVGCSGGVGDARDAGESADIGADPSTTDVFDGRSADVVTEADLADVSDTDTDTGDVADTDTDTDTDTGDVADTDTDTGDIADTDTDTAEEPPTAGRPPHDVPVRYFVAAHQDDDLLFMSPDLLHAVRDEVAVRTVFVTAGDACRGRLPELREDGIRAAYAWMATGVADIDRGWTCGRHIVADMPVKVCEHDGWPHMSVVFVRLPDCGSALDAFWHGATTETVTDPPVALTRDDLIGFFHDEFAALRPLVVNTLDASDSYGNDHSDHIAAARLTFESIRTYGFEGRYREHRTYNTDGDPQNVRGDDHTDKWQAVVEYCVPSGEGDHCRSGGGVGFWEWSLRQYVQERVLPSAGLIGTGSRCLGLSGETPSLIDCDTAPSVTFDGWQVRLGERCLTAADDEVRVGPCDDRPENHFALMSDGQLRAAATRCVTDSGGSIGITACEPGDTGEPSPGQTWSRRMRTPISFGLFTDDELGPSGARSFDLADVDGDRVDDACIRASGGVTCALADGRGDFGEPEVWQSSYADGAGWVLESRDATIRFGDIDGDGADDVCGRGVLGLLCALSNGVDFDPPTLWSSDGEFSDAEDVSWTNPEHWGSLGLIDTDGDGTDDVCARYGSGVRCATSDGTTLALQTADLAFEFTDALGWAVPRHGATLRYGDINGDGLGDVCGRGAAGLICALGDELGFVRPHFWGYRNQLADSAAWPAREQFYASIRLVDLNNNGRDDVCVRGPEGVMCGWSTGTTFARLLTVGGFADADGFATETHGGSLQWGDVDSDGLVDACARHPSGVQCTLTGR